MAAVVAAVPLWVAGDGNGVPRWVGDLGEAALWVADTVFVVLLMTTPADAIRLPVGRSVAWVAGLTAWTYGIRTVGQADAGFGLAAAMGLAGLAAGLAWAAAWRGWSPWWPGAVLWTPWTLRPLGRAESATGSVMGVAVLTVVAVWAVRGTLVSRR